MDTFAFTEYRLAKSGLTVVMVVVLASGFLALFPFEAVRRFCALEIPHGLLAVSLLSAAGGILVLTLVWGLLHRPDRTGPERRQVDPG